MFDNKSIYAKNKKNKDAILYSGVNGLVALDVYDFSSQEEFEKWKHWSDEDYHDTEKKGRSFYDHVISADAMNFEDKQARSAEEILIDQEEEMERKRQMVEQMRRLKKLLTKKQYRRAWLYYAEEWPINAIAELEGVKAPSIENSLSQVKKKIKKSFSIT